jgi:hypothetical protein
MLNSESIRRGFQEPLLERQEQQAAEIAHITEKMNSMASILVSKIK